MTDDTKKKKKPGRAPRTLTTVSNALKFRDDKLDLEPHSYQKDTTYSTVGFRLRTDDELIDNLDNMAKSMGHTRAYLVRRMVLHCVRLWRENGGGK